MDKIELIDRVVVLDKLPQICDELNGCAAPYNFDEHCMGCEVYMLHKMLTDIPTIDAAPVRRGEWRDVTDPLVDEMPSYECAVCGRIGSWRPTPFCPNCGADMRGVSE